MNPARELLIRVMNEKVKEGEKNPNKPTYHVVNLAMLNLLTRNISLHIENLYEEVEKLRLTLMCDKDIRAHRIDRHIFNKDGNLAINATLMKLGYILRRKDKRVVMVEIKSSKELAL